MNMKNKVFKMSIKGKYNGYRAGFYLETLLLSILIFFIAGLTRAYSQDTYTIKKGDTLWDISGRFLDNPFKWNEVWRLNPFIINPDLIFPGERIKLKALKKVKEEVEMLPLAPVPSEVVEKELPPEVSLSLPEFRRSGFLSSEDLKGSGIILESKEGNIILGEGDEVYVSFVKGKDVRPGERFTIFEVKEEVIHPLTKIKVGYKVEPLGSLTIKGSGKDMYIGVIDKSYREIFKGARVKDFMHPLERVTIKEVATPIQGIIITAWENKVTLGEGDVAYIDRGRRDGLNVGNILYIYRERKGIFDPLNEREVFPPPVRIGRMVVLKTGEATSTAFILDSEREIYKGDRVRTQPE